MVPRATANYMAYAHLRGDREESLNPTLTLTLTLTLILTLILILTLGLSERTPRFRCQDEKPSRLDSDYNPNPKLSDTE